MTQAPEPAARPGSSGISVSFAAGGVAVVSLLTPGSSVNLLTRALLRDLDEAIAAMELAIDEGEVTALVVRSVRPGSFLAGADLEEILAVGDAGQATEMAREGQRVLRRLELLPVSTVASIDGACLGPGLELALACGHRLASDAPRTRFGFPEVRVGLVPGLGGTVRLPRLVGLGAALEIILSGAPISAPRALELGIVDRLVGEDDLDSEALRLAITAAELPRRRAGRGLRVRMLEETAPGRRLALARAAARLPDASLDTPLAVRAALQLVAEGVALPLEEAFAREAVVVGELAASDQARALVSVFRAEQLLRRRTIGAHPPEHAGVLGAGEVGSEMAAFLLAGGAAVRLRERRRETLVRGERRTLSRIAEETLSGRISEEEADRRGARLSSGAGFGGFGLLDLVVAAEGEGSSWVGTALREAADHTREDCILAFASPLLSATEVQSGIRFPERVLGLHPAVPGGAFPLVEVSVGEDTAPAKVRDVAALVRMAGMPPLVVPASAATPATRLLGVYLAEATRLMEEGAALEQIDIAAEEFGFTFGPLRRFDAVGAQRAARWLRHLTQLVGERFQPSDLLDRIAPEADSFYLYRRGRATGPNPVLPRGIPVTAGSYAEPIRSRLLLLLINEAAHLLEEGLLSEGAEVELAAIHGLGFPRTRGGLLFHAMAIGLPVLLEQMEGHARRFGERFAPAPLLLRVARAGGSLLKPPAAGQREGEVLS